MATKAIKHALTSNERLKAISKHLTKVGDMDGKVIAITGAASGIGLALAKILAIRGARISISDASQINLEKAVHDLTEYARSSDYLLAQVVDVREPTQLQAWIKQTINKFGKLDGAANLAGVIDRYLPESSWHEEDNSEWDRLLSVNLTGTANSMKAELAVMQAGGAIVNATSVAGLSARAGTVPYVATKHGVVGLTKTIARRYGPERGIRVNAVAPGPISTPLLAGVEDQIAGKQNADALLAALPLRRRGDADEAAKVFAFLLSDDASYVSGAVWTVDGGMSV